MHGVVAELALLGVGLTADHPGDLLALVSPGVVHDGVDIHFFFLKIQLPKRQTRLTSPEVQLIPPFSCSFGRNKLRT